MILMSIESSCCSEVPVKESVSSRVGLVPWAISLMPFCILFATEDSFTFQTAIPAIAVMMMAFVFSPQARKYSKHALIIMIGFITIIGISECITILHDDYLITNKTLIRAFMFCVIVWFYATAVSYHYSRKEICFILKSISISVFFSSFLEFLEYFKKGGYFGRVYPVSLRGHQLDANYFALLIVVQVAIAYIVALHVYKAREKILFFICVGVGLISIILTGSRSGLMCVFLILGLGAIFYFGKTSKGRRRNTFFFLIFGIFLYAASSRFMSGWMFDRFFANSYKDDSNEQRVVYWINAVNRWPQRPVFGFGVGNYNYFFAKDQGLAEAGAVTTHGTLTDFLVDFGILGLFLFIYMVCSCVRLLLRTHNYMIISLLPGIIVCSIIIGAERTVALWLWLMLFRILGEYFNHNHNESLSTLFIKEK